MHIELPTLTTFASFTFFLCLVSIVSVYIYTVCFPSPQSSLLCNSSLLSEKRKEKKKNLSPSLPHTTSSTDFHFLRFFWTLVRGRIERKVCCRTNYIQFCTWYVCVRVCARSRVNSHLSIENLWIIYFVDWYTEIFIGYTTHYSVTRLYTVQFIVIR